ncbi:hypothetical protein EDC01DRAFT_783131 [Geopyxis carbonaria]|nr:hypothetical protein EDC01DRAFT_783131 [Geopyxis carbonaria]
MPRNSNNDVYPKGQIALWRRQQEADKAAAENEKRREEALLLSQLGSGWECQEVPQRQRIMPSQQQQRIMPSEPQTPFDLHPNPFKKDVRREPVPVDALTKGKKSTPQERKQSTRTGDPWPLIAPEIGPSQARAGNGIRGDGQNAGQGYPLSSGPVETSERKYGRVASGSVESRTGYHINNSHDQNVNATKSKKQQSGYNLGPNGW